MKSDENEVLENEEKDFSYKIEKDVGKVTSYRRKPEESNEHKFR